jgi:hypothetical protein
MIRSDEYLHHIKTVVRLISTALTKKQHGAPVVLCQLFWPTPRNKASAAKCTWERVVVCMFGLWLASPSSMYIFSAATLNIWLIWPAYTRPCNKLCVCMRNEQSTLYTPWSNLLLAFTRPPPKNYLSHGHRIPTRELSKMNGSLRMPSTRKPIFLQQRCNALQSCAAQCEQSLLIKWWWCWSDAANFVGWVLVL